MATRRQYLQILDLRGGRNGSDPPLSLSDDQCVEALNVDWFESTVGNKRNGASSSGFTGGGAVGYVELFRHLPTALESAAELWSVDSNDVIRRLAAGTAWSAPTVKDAISNNLPYGVSFASLNGKLFIAYDSAQPRMHVWDGSTVRRTGLATPATPTGSAGAAGGNTWTRFYRVRWVQDSSGDIERRSEASGSVDGSITSKTGYTVNRPTLASEGETYWEVEAAETSSGPWYRIATVAAATTTYADTSASILTDFPSDEAGNNTNIPAGRFILADENKLLICGDHDTTAYASRVWFTPALGTADVGDDERVIMRTDRQDWVDLDRGDGGGITGIGGPLNGSPYVFKQTQIYKLVRTGLSAAPYVPHVVSKSVGCVRHHTITLGVDETGASCLYFLSRQGPYRIGPRGLEYLGNDIEDIWATVNFAASRIGHGVYHPDKHQVWWYVSTGANTNPDTKIVFDVKLGRSTAQGVLRGWSKHTVPTGTAYCSVMFSNTPGATMSLDLKPYTGHDSGSILKNDDPSDDDDNGTDFQAYIKTKPYALAGLGRNARVRAPHLVAQALAGKTVQLTIDRDFGSETVTDTVSLAPDGSESRIVRDFEAGKMARAGVLQFQIGDAAAAEGAWALDALVVPFEPEEERG